MPHVESEHLLIFGSAMVAGWFVLIYFWPLLLLYVYKRAILVKGFGDGPIPINTLYMQPQHVFADPLAARASGSKLSTTGVNRDTLITIGWLDLSKGSPVLRVPLTLMFTTAGPYFCVMSGKSGISGVVASRELSCGVSGASTAACTACGS